MKKEQFLRVIISISLLGTMFLNTACKKDDKTEDSDSSINKILVIQNGAQSILPDGNIEYSAILVDNTGAISTPTNIKWSVSNSEIASISNSGNLTINSVGNINIKAEVDVSGSIISSTVPLRIYTPSIFSVVPSAIIYEKGGEIQLEPIYFSVTGVEPAYSYISDNVNIASVNSSGLVQFIAPGQCNIKVTADLDGNPEVLIPVSVIEVPSISLPVSRVEIGPASVDLFKNETVQLNASVFDSEGETLTDKSIIWNSLNTAIATVNSSGLVVPVNTGTTYIQAVVDGIIGQAEVVVNPDTLVIIDPYYVSIVPAAEKQLVANAYHITRTTTTPINGIDFTWMVPSYGFDMFDIGTVTQTGLFTAKDDALPGMPGFVTAFDSNNPKVGGVTMVSIAIASDCDCGDGNSEVSNIVVGNGYSINISVMNGPVPLNVTAYDTNGDEVLDPSLVFCSDNIQVVNVDSDGMLTGANEGTASIKICSGNYAEISVTVNVTLM